MSGQCSLNRTQASSRVLREEDPVFSCFEALGDQLPQTVIVFDHKDDPGTDAGQDRLRDASHHTTGQLPCV